MDSINKITPVSFGARHVSSISVNLGSVMNRYRIYELNKGDDEFVQKLVQAVDLKKLMPTISDSHLLNVWNSIFKAAVTQSNDFLGKGVKNYLLVNGGNKPCGAMSIFKYLNSIYDKYKLRYICTWPTSVGHREPYAGKSLILSLFNKILGNDNPSSKIELEALNNGLFSPVSKYLEMGFSISGGDNHTTDMRILRNKMPKIIEKFKDILTVERVKEPEDVDLSQVLDISY